MARLTLAFLPSMIGFGSLHARSAASFVDMITCKAETEDVVRLGASGFHATSLLKDLCIWCLYTLKQGACGIKQDGCRGRGGGLEGVKVNGDLAQNFPRTWHLCCVTVLPPVPGGGAETFSSACIHIYCELTVGLAGHGNRMRQNSPQIGLYRDRLKPSYVVW